QVVLVVRLLQDHFSYFRNKLARTGRSTLVYRQCFALTINARDGIIQALSLVEITKIVKQQYASQQHSRWINTVLPGQIGRGTMNRLEIGIVFAVAGAGSQTQTADTARGHVSQD